LQRLGHCPYPPEFYINDARRRLTIGLWQQTATKPQFDGLAQAYLHLSHGPHLTGETHFTQNYQVRIKDDISQAGHHRHHNPKVSCWFLYRQATHNVDIHIMGRQRQAKTFFQDGQQERHTLIIDTIRDPTRHAQPTRAAQRLKFDQQGTRPLHAGNDNRAARLLWTFCQQEF
jgi:hypothetical protein